MTIEPTILESVATHLGMPRHEINAETAIGWQSMGEINNDVCFALMVNISTVDAMACKTVGDYAALVSKAKMAK